MILLQIWHKSRDGRNFEESGCKNIERDEGTLTAMLMVSAQNLEFYTMKVIANLSMFYRILWGQIEYIKNFPFIGIILYNIGYLMFV